MLVQTEVLIMDYLVPYREVHAFLEANHYVLVKSIKGTNLLHRFYASKGKTRGRPLIHFPVQGQMVLEEHFEKIKEIVAEHPAEEDGE